MKDTKKYYWIKLRTDFFNQETIDFLLSQQNGCEYVVLYQMLCLQTANTNGSFINQIGEMLIPYNIEKIVRDTKYFDYDTIAVALELYKKIGLVYEEENGNLKITNFDKMIGFETEWAEKKRIYREKQKILKDNVKDNVLEENRDKILEYRDIDNRNIILKENIKRKYFEDEKLNNIFIEFLELRKKLKAVNTDRAINTLLNKLNDYDDDIKYRMIEQSIVNSWKGLFELKLSKKELKEQKEKEIEKWLKENENE